MSKQVLIDELSSDDARTIGKVQCVEYQENYRLYRVELKANPHAALIAQCDKDKVDYPDFWWELWQKEDNYGDELRWVSFSGNEIFHEQLCYRQHPHRVSIIEFHQCSDEDKKRWQSKCNEPMCGCNKEWISCPNPKWNNGVEYRMKPKVCQITIGGKVLEYPEPVCELLEDGQEYWVSDVINGQVHKHFWRNDSIDNKLLKAGLIQLTKQSANQHLEVLQAVNAQTAI